MKLLLSSLLFLLNATQQIHSAILSLSLYWFQDVEMSDRIHIFIQWILVPVLFNMSFHELHLLPVQKQLNE